MAEKEYTLCRTFQSATRDTYGSQNQTRQTIHATTSRRPTTGIRPHHAQLSRRGRLPKRIQNVGGQERTLAHPKTRHRQLHRQAQEEAQDSSKIVSHRGGSTNMGDSKKKSATIWASHSRSISRDADDETSLKSIPGIESQRNITPAYSPARPGRTA